MIFKTGDFTLASGLQSTFKIDCDELTNDDLYSLALYANKFLPDFKQVYGVPRGGIRFADQMRKFVSPDGCILVVDDVFTTGKSMINFIEDNKIDDNNRVQGLVIFARNPPLPWIKSIFTMSLS
jgi:orotate phosphoribosyltransferase